MAFGVTAIPTPYVIKSNGIVRSQEMPLFVEQRGDQPTAANQLLQLPVLRRLNLSSLIGNRGFCR